MAKRIISQREARRLERQVARLENQISTQRTAWATTWPGGTHLGTVDPGIALFSAVKTAKRLNHAVVATIINSEKVELYALPLPNEAI